MEWQASDHRFMTRAIQLARRGIYTTHPNPRVGCVLVRDNNIVAEGWHQYQGGDHAEVDALNKISGSTDGLTAYVTLEPCDHEGHTGPCTKALIDAGVSKVVIAMQDPNPLVSGKGTARLKQAGVETQVGLMQDEAIKLNPGFIKRMQSGQPFVRCKMAMSLDGRSAMSDGESKWITSDAARKDVHAQRAASSAVMTGIGTILADDPSLTVRDIEVSDRQPLRVVLDRKLRMPLKAKMLSLPGRTLVITELEDQAKISGLKKAGAEVVSIDETGPAFLRQALAYLAEHEELNEILLEAGAELSGACIEQGLVDEIVLYQAPVFMGDKARPVFQLPSIHKMADKIDLQLLDSRMFAEDRRLIYQLRDPSQT